MLEEKIKKRRTHFLLKDVYDFEIFKLYSKDLNFCWTSLSCSISTQQGGKFQQNFHQNTIVGRPILFLSKIPLQGDQCQQIYEPRVPKSAEGRLLKNTIVGRPTAAKFCHKYHCREANFIFIKNTVGGPFQQNFEPRIPKSAGGSLPGMIG